MPDRVVFRSRFNRVLSIALWAVLGTVIVMSTVLRGAEALPGLLPFVAAAVAVWAVLWRPAVVVDDEGVDLVNVLRFVHVPWPALVHVDTKYALTLHVPGRAYTATAAPAPGRMSAALARRHERRSAGADGAGLRPGDLPATDSGRAAAMVRGRWEQLRDAGRIEAGLAAGTPVLARWDPTGIGALLLAAALLAVGPLLG